MRFVLGFVVIVAGFGALAPHSQSTSVPPSTIPSFECGTYATPIKAVLTEDVGYGPKIYQVTCSDGVIMTVSH